MSPPRPGARRAPSLLVAFVLLLGAASCTSPGGARGPVPTLMQMARAVGSDAMRSLVRGYVPGRSGEILLVPKPWHVLAQWNGGYRGTGDPRTTHSTPWSYHQRVPIALYGPGFIREGGVVDRVASVADLAPTLAELAGFDLDVRGRPLTESLLPSARRRDAPRAVVVVVMDGGGWNVLERWPHAWPAARRLMTGGTTYTNATIGSTPSVTAPIHATIGTGEFPARHGITENSLRLPDGTMGDVTLDRGNLSLLRVPTFADLWDREVDNRAWVGMVGYETWHLGMMGSGALHDGDDRDVAVLWEQQIEDFWTNEAYYELPSYLPDREDLQVELDALDGSDGARDGTWRGHTLDPTAYAFTANPAFAAHMGKAATEILARAPIGRDEITDLFFVELKTGDVAGHVWNMESGRLADVWRTQDAVIEEILDLLDRRVGRGRYVVALTADHGQTPTPESSGGLRIDRYGMLARLNALFGSAVETVQPGDLFLNLEEAEDVDLEAMARYIGAMTYGDALPEGLDDADVPEALLDDAVFAGAFPGSFLESLSPADIEALGPGAYPESDLSTPPALAAFPA